MTSLEIVFSEGAENDFNQIAEWYKEIRGVRFGLYPLFRNRA